jgi:ribonuclease BN (tRNA processing enzyme)
MKSVNLTLWVPEPCPEYEEKFDKLLSEPSTRDPDSLVVLKRWNSFSPIVSWRRISEIQSAEEDVWRRMRREVRGGGYLFRWKGFGVAVDPGHDFIENLYEAGFSIADLNAVVVSHDHLDHTADFEALLDLLYQRNKRGHTQSLSVFLNPTTHRKYQRMLRHHPHIARVSDIRVDRPAFRWISKSPGIKLFACQAQHAELGGFKEGVCLRFDLLSRSSGKRTRLGFTADTGWHAGLAPFFRETDILVAHLGSVKSYELDEARRYPTHLGILGLFKLIEEIKAHGSNPTVIVSEFGEELMGLRDLVAHELGERFPDLRIFPGDIGHRVELEPGNLRIVCSQRASCQHPACVYFEQEGEICLRCESHRPTFGKIDAL